MLVLVSLCLVHPKISMNESQFLEDTGCSIGPRMSLSEKVPCKAS